MNSSPRKRRSLRARLLKNLARTHPAIVLRILAVWVVFSPWFLLTLLLSWIKTVRWNSLSRCRRFMRRQQGAFRGVDPDSLEMVTLSGGLSNSNRLWRCRLENGGSAVYFVKVFVSLGTFWAKNLSLVGPFPEIYGVSMRERFAVDMVSRVLLAERGVAVPRLVAFDAVEQVLVTEYLDGENIDDVLKRTAACGLDEELRLMLAQCGTGVGRIHRAGYCLIDIQPVNCIWMAREQRVYFTDLEYCTRSDKRIWDAAYFICFLMMRMPGGLKNEARRIFLENYEKESGIALARLEGVHARLMEYLPVLQVILDLREFKPEALLGELVNPAG